MKRAMLALTLLALGAAGVVACDRTHLSPTYGRATRAAFAGQVIDPLAGSRDGGVGGLDPQEAAIVAEAHRRSLSTKGAEDSARRSPVLIVPQNQPGGAQPQP